MIFFRSLNLTVDWDGMGCGFGVLGVGLRRLSEEEEASHHGLYIAPLWPFKQRNATEGKHLSSSLFIANLSLQNIQKENKRVFFLKCELLVQISCSFRPCRQATAGSTRG
ncbi:hypothetical protein EE612_013734 [Oryza sativa]|nr:hypothetical protein EE612_013734 [Oryza sativa]